MSVPFDPFNDWFLEEETVLDVTPHINVDTVKNKPLEPMAPVEFYWTDGVAQNHINHLTAVYGISSGMNGSEDNITKRMFLEQLADKSRSLRDALFGLRNDPTPQRAY